MRKAHIPFHIEPFIYGQCLYFYEKIVSKY